MQPIRLSVLKDFSATPGPRYIREGEFSGESFRKTVLLPRFKDAIESGVKLYVDLDGTAGYGTSFLEEAFGGLVRVEAYSSEMVRAVVVLKSDEEEYLIDDVHRYIEDANNEKK